MTQTHPITPPPELVDQPVAQSLHANYIDPEHTGQDRELLEIFYTACQSEGGTADEIHLRGIRAVLASRQRPAAACGGGGVVKITYTFKKTHFDGTKEVMRFSDCTHQEAFDAAHRWGWTAPRWWQWWRWVDGPRKSCANALPTPEGPND